MLEFSILVPNGHSERMADVNLVVQYSMYICTYIHKKFWQIF